jgi:hypothetical protein
MALLLPDVLCGQSPPPQGFEQSSQGLGARGLLPYVATLLTC